jgi:hypothetical protein
MAAKSKILKAYLDAYRGLVASERVSDKAIPGESTTISIPLHFAGNHRVEVTVTEFSPGRFILSDMARTLGELSESGSRITPDFRRRTEEIIGQYGARLVKDHLLMDCDKHSLGNSIQKFSEAAKTIGDAYLLQRTRSVHVREVVGEVKQILASRQLHFKENQKVKGALEQVSFDLLVPPNGKPGLALAVVAGGNTHSLAKVWAFNCLDVRELHADKLKLGVIIDEEDSAPWTKHSRQILKKGADIVASSKDLSSLEHGMILQGIA